VPDEPGESPAPGEPAPTLTSAPGTGPDAGPGSSPGSGRETIEAAYRRLRTRLLRLAHLMAGCPETAQDVVQDAFMAAARHWSRVENVDAYLRMAVVNGALSSHRRAGRERDKTARLQRLTTVVTVGIAEVDETWEVLRRLPDMQRAALVLRFYEDLSEAEIARLLGCRPGTVKSLVHRGLARTRKALP
jgi:RNA polymerase sigma factor (sigma-70 family)